MSEQEVFDALKYRVVVDEHGIRKYYNSAGKLHRANGPAAICADDTKLWYQNGLRHRIDGPAIVTPGGYKAWYINGQPVTETQFNQAVKSL